MTVDLKRLVRETNELLKKEDGAQWAAQYPEHMKLKDVVLQTQIAGEFYDWLRSFGAQIMDIEGRPLLARDDQIQHLLLLWKDIDPVKLAKEKMFMAEEFAEQQKNRNRA